MDWLPRLLLRLLLASLGYAGAAFVGGLVVLVSRPLFEGSGRVEWLMGATLLMGIVSLFVLRPAIVGILISEIFAIRSWLFHVINYLVSAWIGWHIIAHASTSPFHLEIVVGGIAGGLVYWGVAGRNAGLSKPVSDKNDPSPPGPQQPRRMPIA
jgi:hypothetical protein